MASPERGRHSKAFEIEAAARQLVGMRFRPQGRGVGGIDCLGVLIVVAEAAGITIDARRDYRICYVDLREVLQCLYDFGFDRLLPREASVGDVLLSCPGTRQVHFAVRVTGGLVEAHVGLRRVIRRPIARSDQFHSAWRLPEYSPGQYLSRQGGA